MPTPAGILADGHMQKRAKLSLERSQQIPDFVPSFEKIAVTIVIGRANLMLRINLGSIELSIGTG